jgi:hypothetical protein
MSDQAVRVKTCTFNSVAITGVTEFDYDDSGSSVKNRADNETYATDQLLVTADVTGSITGIDQEEFSGAALGTSATLVVVGIQVSDGSDVTITVSNCMMLGNTAGLSHSSEGAAGLTWEATSSDGSTSPIAYT